MPQGARQSKAGATLPAAGGARITYENYHGTAWGFMIITCPSCSARFRVADEQIGSDGRVVRCGRCAYSWHQMPIPPEPAPLELSEPLGEETPLRPGPGRREELYEPEPRYEEPRGLPIQRPPYRKPRRSGHLAGWLIFLLVLAGIAAAGWYWRDKIVAAVPETAKVYDWLGIEIADPAAEGRLELVNYTFVRRLVEGERKLVVAGEVVNRSSDPLQVPPLRARVLDESGNEILRWDFAAEQGNLQPGASTRFESLHEHPDYGGELDVEVGFVPAQ